MPLSDVAVPEPQRKLAELTELGLGHVRRLRQRRRVQMSIAIFTTIAVAAGGTPALMQATRFGEVQNIAPIDRPDRPRGDLETPSRQNDSGDRPHRPGSPAGSDASSADNDDAADQSSEQTRSRGVVFASFRDDADASELYRMLPDGSGVERLTESTASETQPAWSPDGTRVAYTRGDYRPADGPHDIFITEPGSDSPRELTDTSEHESSPSWSPDGGRLVFSREVIGDYSDLFAIDVVSGRTEKLTNTPEVDEWEANWSPDGKRIVFQRVDWSNDAYEHGIYVMNADGSDLRRLTTGRDVEPAWSPDGRSIVFSRFTNLGGAEPGGVSATPADSASLYAMNADGSGIRRVTNDSSVIDYAADWSPDGQTLIFTRDPDGSQGTHATFEWASGQPGGPLSAIYVVGVDGSDLDQLTDPSSGDVYADWS